jgi:hypothetical protein
MADKFAPVTDPAETAELEKLDGDLGRPIPFKQNGHLWVDSEELKQWRAYRASSNDVQG